MSTAAACPVLSRVRMFTRSAPSSIPSSSCCSPMRSAKESARSPGNASSPAETRCGGIARDSSRKASTSAGLEKSRNVVSTTPLQLLPLFANFNAAPTITVSTLWSASLPSCEGVQRLLGVNLVGWSKSALNTRHSSTDEMTLFPPLATAWYGARFSMARAMAAKEAVCAPAFSCLAAFAERV